MAELTDTDIRERVRERYAAAARAVSDEGGCACASEIGRASCRERV